jgi:arsenite methyltransferase
MPNATLSLRNAQANDWPQIAKLLTVCGLPLTGAESTLDTFTLAVVENQVAAAAAVEIHGEHGLLRSVAVDPAWRGQGLGADIVRAAIALARGRQLHSLTLLTTTAAPYFPRFGFVPVERAAAPAAVQQSAEFQGVCPASAAVMHLPLSDVKAQVKQRYGQAALQVVSAVVSGGANCCGGDKGPITSDLYNALEQSELPAEAMLASLGCGNPTALAELQAGETVLDLGSGGGIDVLLSAKRVGPTGKAYGLDMTEEMLALARENQRRAGAANVEFLKGEIEAIPLPDATVDVIVSNCVINLSADKDRVLAEAFRVLKPGGRLAVSDVVVRGEVPASVRRSMELWVGCIAGALEEGEYQRKLARAGFTEISVEPTRIYNVADAREFLTGQGIDTDALAPLVDGKFMSAFIRAHKPLSS